MSRLVWAKALVPAANATADAYAAAPYDATPEAAAARALRLPVDNKDIAIPDGRAYRSMSRAALFLADTCLKAEPLLKATLERDPFRVGFYAAVDSGPIDYASSVELGTVAPEDFAERYKKIRSPKIYLKQLPNLAPAQVGIFLGIRGPLCVYTHSFAAGLQALEQAELDLQDNVVDIALVAGAFSLEDSLQSLRTLRAEETHGQTLAEGAGALVLENNGRFTDWARLTPSNSDSPRRYGVAHTLVEWALSMEEQHERTTRSSQNL